MRAILLLLLLTTALAPAERVRTRHTGRTVLSQPQSYLGKTFALQGAPDTLESRTVSIQGVLCRRWVGRWQGVTYLLTDAARTYQSTCLRTGTTQVYRATLLRVARLRDGTTTPVLHLTAGLNTARP